VAAVVAALVAAPVAAENHFEDIVKLEVRPGWTQSDGTQIAALRMSLAPGWKTYWRAPGDTGIPPQFFWQGSSNINDVQISWPTPSIFYLSGLRSIGYQDELVIPLEIKPNEPGKQIRIKGEIDVGVCKDVCIPRTLSFDQLVEAGHSKRDPVIAAAMASRPYSASEAGVQSATCKLSPIDGGLRISTTIVMPSAGGTEVAVIEPGDPQIWASEAVTKRSGKKLTASSDLIHVSENAFALDRSKIRITVLGGKYSVDVRGCTPS